MESTKYLLSAAFVAAFALTSFAPAAVAPAFATGDCGCQEPDKPSKPGKNKQKGNNGFGNGANDGVPGRSGKTDATR